MLTNEQIAEIRAQHEAVEKLMQSKADKFETAAIRAMKDTNAPVWQLFKALNAVCNATPALLAALEAERASPAGTGAMVDDIEHAKQVIRRWEKLYEKELERRYEAEDDRDRHKARAEALERAAVGQCFACIHFQSPSTAEPCYDCSLTALDTLEHGKHWVFDEAKFAGGGVK